MARVLVALCLALIVSMHPACAASSRIAALRYRGGDSWSAGAGAESVPFRKKPWWKFWAKTSGDKARESAHAAKQSAKYAGEAAKKAGHEVKDAASGAKDSTKKAARDYGILR